MKTLFIKPAEVQRKWFVVDAKDKVLGRVAAKVAYILRGKHKPLFTPHQEVGDYVVIINADKAVLTGDKAASKMYYAYSGYKGGMRADTFATLAARKPTAPLELAVKGMLPKGRLGRKLFTNLKVYAGDRHPHAAQQPEVLEV